MKKYILLLFIFSFSSIVSAQNKFDSSKINSSFLKFLPSNQNPEDLRPSDIPSKQVLKQIGLSDSEIKQALDFKYSRGEFQTSKSDTIENFSKLKKLYSSFDDTLVLDTTSYPKGRIFGQDIFRNQNISFFFRKL